MGKRRNERATSVQPDENPSWLFDEPEGAEPRPPVSTRARFLPFLELKWEDFERLCLRMSQNSGKAEAAWSYGKVGHAQYGIDILVRRSDSTYEVWQSKRHKTFSTSQLKAAVQFFLAHKWASKAKSFVLAAACNFSSPDVVEAIEEARDQLKARGITFDPRDAEKLTEQLRSEPEIVDDFFGRAWVEVISPPEGIQRLASRLSRFEIASIRQRLQSCYSSWIATVDPGLPIAGQDSQGRMRPGISISRRYVQPDIILRTERSEKDGERSPDPGRNDDDIKYAAESGERELPPTRGAVRASGSIPRELRISLDEYLGSKDQSLIVGDAGSGKSTLLRFLALDILTDQPTLNFARGRYRNFLPVWVPFALWTRMAVDQRVPPAIQDVVFEFFRAQNEPVLAQEMRAVVDTHKILLLVDGLDEASDQAAAQTLIALLTAFVERNKIPVVVTSRRHGIRTLSGFGGGWSRVELAPLSDEQRHALAKCWFGVLEEIEAEGRSSPAQVEAHSVRKAENFISALQRNPGITRLSQTPLFLLALLDLHRHGHDLPRSRFAASKEIVEQLIEHQPKRREVSSLAITVSLTERRLRDRLIADFAFALQSEELRGTVPDATAEGDAVLRASKLVLERQGGADVERAEATARSIFSFSEERVGILVKKTPDNIGFLHLSLQEYLAARHIMQWSLERKLDFIRCNAENARWSEPILYLLSLVENEREVGELVEAIEIASVSDLHGQAVRDALLTDAVFADFSHSLPIARRLAERFFEETEMSAWGARQRHLLASAVDGLFSESIGEWCRNKIKEWVPDRHGYARGPAIRAMSAWDVSTRPACIAPLFRCLRSDAEYTWRPAAQAISSMADANGDVRASLSSLATKAPSVSTLQASILALGCGWASDPDVGEIANSLRNNAHDGLALDAIRIRARRNETDTGDLDRFLSMAYGIDQFRGLFARDLVEHFAAAHRARFTERLVERLKNAHSEPFRWVPSLAISLAIADPDNPLIEDALRRLLAEDWGWHELFLSHEFPLARVRWSPDLISAIEARVASKSELYEYEFYWINRAVSLPSIKQKFIEALQQRKHLSFWSSRALAESWGKSDPEVRSIFESFLDASPQEVAMVAGELPLIVEDKDACRRALIRALRAPQERLDFLVSGLRILGTSSNDEEAVQAALTAGRERHAPAYEGLWRARIIETFPTHPEVRQIARMELDRRDGHLGSVSSSYRNDPEMCLSLLKVLCPLDDAARTILISNVATAAQSNDTALQILASSRQDSRARISSQATIGWVDAGLVRSTLEASDIDDLALELEATGRTNDERRAAASIGLALAGHIDRVVKAKGYDGKPLVVKMNPRLSGDDTYIRRLLPLWDELRKAFGGEEELLARFELTPELIFPILNPGFANADHLFKLLMMQRPRVARVNRGELIRVVERFSAQSLEMRDLVTPVLLAPGEGRTIGDCQASLAAADIFVEHYADDSTLLQQIVDRFVSNPASAGAAAALAELMLRQPEPNLMRLLEEKSNGVRYDVGTHFKLTIALGSSNRLTEEIKKYLVSRPGSQMWSLGYWVPSLIRRIKSDADLEKLLFESLSPDASASIKVSFPAVLGRARGASNQLRDYATTELSRLQQAPVPIVGFDLTTYGHRPSFQVLTELLS